MKQNLPTPSQDNYVNEEISLNELNELSEISKSSNTDMPNEKKDDVNSEEVEKQVRKKILFEVLDWVKSIVFGVVIGVLVVVFVIQRSNVFGDSMMPTLNSGDVIFAEKISTYFANYSRGDIVILDGSGMEGYNREEFLVKRIIGIPGDTIRIQDGCVYLRESGQTEFVMLNELYLQEGTSTTMNGVGISRGYDEITLGDNEYYCMGDNRMVSNDSRNLGPFTEDRIRGVAVILVYPFSSFGLL